MNREENRAKNTEEFEAGAEVLESRPRFIFVELTRNCNLYCIMCRPQPIRYDPKLDMPFDRFARVAEDLFPTADVVDLRGWGESTLVRDFLRYVEHAASYGCRLRLYSNMQKKDDGIWDALADVGCIVGISFDGGKKETFEAIRRGAKFETVTANIEKLAAANLARQGHTRDVYLSSVVQRANLEEIHLIVELAAGMGLELVKLFPIHCHPDSPDHLRHYPDRIRAMLERACETGERLGVRLEVAATLHDSLTLQQKVFPACVHPWMYALVTPDGSLGFCDHLVAFPQYWLGDLKEQPLMEIWNNDLFRQLRREHRGLIREGQPISQRFTDCNWCYANRYVDTEHLVYPPLAEQIVTARSLLQA